MVIFKALANFLYKNNTQTAKERKPFAENAGSSIIHHFDEKDYINRQVNYINQLLQ